MTHSSGEAFDEQVNHYSRFTAEPACRPAAVELALRMFVLRWPQQASSQFDGPDLA